MNENETRCRSTNVNVQNEVNVKMKILNNQRTHGHQQLLTYIDMQVFRDSAISTMTTIDTCQLLFHQISVRVNVNDNSVTKS
jgi:hypothetical protein